MSMIAIFRMTCCGKRVISGRFQGNDMYPPSVAKCHYGCKPKNLPNGRQGRIPMIFEEYASEELQPEELMRTWKHGHSVGDLWHRYNREWLKKKASIDQGRG